MKLSVNYFYKQRYLPTKRHRKYRERKLSGVASITIKEPALADFPIAFIIHDMQSVCEGMKFYSDYDGKKSNYRMFDEEIRTYKGKLYTPVRVTHGAAISTEFENEQDIIHHLEYFARDFWISETNEYSEKSIIIDDNSKFKIKCIQDEANRYVFYAGKFWKTINEPRYLINTFGLGHNHGGTGFFIEYHYNPNIPAKNYFNALQREEAVAYGKMVATKRGDTESVDRIGPYCNIEVLIPEMVKIDPNKQHGGGNDFMNTMNAVIDESSSIGEAEILCLALAMKEIS